MGTKSVGLVGKPLFSLSTELDGFHSGVFVSWDTSSQMSRHIYLPRHPLESTQKAEREASEDEEHEAQTSAHMSEPSRGRAKTDRHGTRKLNGPGTV
jgi:hypothetical protein